jgi:hypothetical protein
MRRSHIVLFSMLVALSSFGCTRQARQADQAHQAHQARQEAIRVSSVERDAAELPIGRFRQPQIANLHSTTGS